MAVLMATTSCYYDHEGILYPETANCVAPDAPSFSQDILPLLNARCNLCHSGSAPSADIRLDNYSSVSIYTTNGSLLGSVQHSGGFSPMPKNSSKLSACEIQKIQNWISSGSLNN